VTTASNAGADDAGVLGRETLHRVCAHVLGRRRHQVSGRFGLRAGPTGIATPAFGQEPEVLRVSGPILVRELGGDCTWTALEGSTLRQLASFASTSLDTSFDGDPDAPLQLGADAVADLAGWFSLAWHVLDTVTAALAAGATAATVQLWPEHFDAATTVTLPGSDSVNLGFSPGDVLEPEPYIYVGPWGARRPGDASFWNAPFGALRRRRDLGPEGAALHGACTQFLTEGLRLAATSS
jgi:hypothetical protein